MEFLAKNMFFENKRMLYPDFGRIRRIFERKAIRKLGIDINHSSARVIELSQRNQSSSMQVERFGYAAIPPGAMVDNCIEDISAVGAAITEAICYSGSKLTQAALAVAGGSVINKVIEVPEGMGSSDLELFLALNADKYIPFPLDEVALDFHKLDSIPGGDHQEKVLLTACRKDTVEKLVAAAKIAGISADIVDVAPLCAERALAYCDDLSSANISSPRFIADIGKNHIVCNLIDSNGALFVWEESIQSSDEMDKLLIRNGPQGFEHFLKNDVEKIAVSDKLSIESEFFGSVIGELTRALQLASSTTNLEVKDLIIVGSIAFSEEALVEIQKHLNVTVSMANPFRDMMLGSEINPRVSASYSSTMTTACGLALRGFL